MSQQRRSVDLAADRILLGSAHLCTWLSVRAEEIATAVAALALATL